MTDAPATQEPWERPGLLSPQEFSESEGVEDWRPLGDAVYAFFRTDSFPSSARLVQKMAELPHIDEDHQPAVDIRGEGVTVRLTTIATGLFFNGYTARDVATARQISAAAADLGIPADPTRVQHISVSIDAISIPEVMPFWREALGYEFRRDTEEDVVDPSGRGPSFWFQQMDAPRPQRNRIHVDIAVPPEQSEARIAAVLAAGGRRVHPDQPWILSDPEGNEVCLG